MYISACMSDNYKEVLVWERKSHTERVVKHYRAPFYFYINDEYGEFTDIYGNKLRKIESDSGKSLKELKEAYRSSGCTLYESDISPEYKILSEFYYDSQIPALNITFLDIEVDYDKTRAFPSVEDPYAPISAIAFHHYWSNTTKVYVVPPETWKNFSTDDLTSDITSESEVIICKTEKELLLYLLKEIEDSDILSGWNSEGYDIPYIYKRLQKVLSEEHANKLSFPMARKPRVKEVLGKNGIPRQVVELSGRVSLDYLEIFKKFEVVEKPSYTLEAISEEKLPDLPKMSYEGSLYDLYRNNFLDFIRYNVRDAVVLKGFEDTLGYVQLAIHMSHMACGLIPNITGTIKLAELAIINYCHYNLNAKVPDAKFADSSGEKYTGALVLPPQVGMHEMIGAIDIASLYPSTIRGVNISPETLYGQFLDNSEAYYQIADRTDKELLLLLESGESLTLKAKEWAEYLPAQNLSLSGFGTVFSLNKKGFIPAILEDWFKSRKDYKKKYENSKKEIQELKSQGVDASDPRIKQLQLAADYCNRVQYIKKIQLNSMYGALGNKFFKFYDVRLAESTTRSGQEILMHMVRKTAELLDGKYTYPSDSCIYSDTDSVYFKTHCKDLDTAVKVGNGVQQLVNESFPTFMSNNFFCNNNFNKSISAELDIIAKRGIFVAKKLYVLKLIYSEGFEVDKLKIMGLQLKKTTIPKPISKKLSQFVDELLDGVSWNEIGYSIVDYKNSLSNVDNILEIGLPKGIKKIEKYTEEYKFDNSTRLPGHIAAGIFWNLCCEEFKDTESPKIVSGMKIKTYYLKKQFGRFKSIAVPTDIKILPEWFNRFKSIIDTDAQIERLVDKPLLNIVKSIGEKIPTQKSLMMSEVLEY
jgi:DNA polymerase elongation subunit (family B)